LARSIPWLAILSAFTSFDYTCRAISSHIIVGGITTMNRATLHALLFGVAVAVTLITPASFAQTNDWQSEVDWAVQNTDAGGSVDCPADYIANGVEYAIAYGGRSAVMNAALFAAYNQNFEQSFNLVLLTQCHNPDTAQRLLNAGQQAVLIYLLSHYQTTGIDPNQVIELAQNAIEILAAAQ
jgi:hypothetical protein